MQARTHLQDPSKLGFRMPAEWEAHAATWTSWPFDDALWHGQLEGVRADFTSLVRTVARFEPVHLLVRDAEAEKDARSRLAGCANLSFHRVPLNDVWFRDNGPLFIRNEAGEIALTDWEFNSWGRKFEWELDNRAPEALASFLGAARFPVPMVMEGGSLEVDGRGTALTTRQCLLSKMRNPDMTEADIAEALRRNLGIERLLWLEDGLEGDHTDGHIDTITRFTDARTIVTCMEDDPADPNHRTMRANFERLQSFRNPEGRPYQVLPLPLPRERMELDGERLPPTYANFYVGNGFVVVPQYGDPHDSKALSLLTTLFPGRHVIGSPSRNLIRGGGAFHCVTQQQPAGPLWRPA